MTREASLVLASSLCVSFSYFKTEECLGFALFHVILFVTSFIPDFHLLTGLQSFCFRSSSEPGLELGSVLVPMVLKSMISKERLGNSSAQSDFKSEITAYLLSSQVMSMATVSVLLLLDKSRRIFSWTLLCVLSVAIAITINQHGDITLPVVCLLLYLCTLAFMLWIFPKTFTLGEAMIIAQTFVLFSVDSWFTLRGKLHYIMPSVGYLTSVTRSVFTVWLQILVFGSALTGYFLLPVFYYLTTISDQFELWVGVIAFYVVILLVFMAILLPWSMLMLGGQNPIGWMMQFVIYSKTRKYLTLYWLVVVMLSICVVIWRNSSIDKLQPRTVVRKYFHLLSIAIFLPGVIWEPSLTHIASGAAFAAFVFLEFVRMARVPPLGDVLHDSLSVFLDEKDAGPVILTHIYLLVGCSLPLWLCGIPVDSRSEKTMEGTLAGLTAQLLCVLVLCSTGVLTIPLTKWSVVFAGLLVTSLLEAWTSQVDNLVLPAFLYSLLSAVW
ncbi:dolichol kinase isoform X2 [Nematostella vectensis]|uniref:dolichol kinase isoform X2 n=1 Tax=Nematostella vectensis TaxID=45351 RepID=UPI00207730E8|nr:dolichol kinase isoform X2 [Nematostella vectensis]